MLVRSNVTAADTTWTPHSASVVSECPVLLLNAFMIFASSVVCGERRRAWENEGNAGKRIAALVRVQFNGEVNAFTCQGGNLL